MTFVIGVTHHNSATQSPLFDRKGPGWLYPGGLGVTDAIFVGRDSRMKSTFGHQPLRRPSTSARGKESKHSVRCWITRYLQ